MREARESMTRRSSSYAHLPQQPQPLESERNQGTDPKLVDIAVKQSQIMYVYLLLLPVLISQPIFCCVLTCLFFAHLQA